MTSSILPSCNYAALFEKGFFYSPICHSLVQDIARLNLAHSIEQELPAIKSALLKNEVRVKHPRDILSLHENVMGITTKILQLRTFPNTDRIIQLWLNALKDLHGKRVFRVGIGPVKFDCSRAMNIIRDQALPRISLAELDRRDQAAFDRAVSLMVDIDNESFGTYFAAGFTGRLLASSDSRCILAKDQDGKPVGYVWGFKLDVQGKKVFHTFSLARKADMAKLGIGTLLSQEGIKKINDKSIDVITLNVMAGNRKAIELYQQLGFKAALQDRELKALPADAKVLMFKNLTDQSVQPGNAAFAKATNSAMASFIIKNVGIFRLALIEMIRRIILLWKKIIYH